MSKDQPILHNHENLIVLSILICYDTVHYIPYSRKYWRELNLTVGSQMAIAKVLADSNLAVRSGGSVQDRHTYNIYASKKFWRILIWWLLR